MSSPELYLLNFANSTYQEKRLIANHAASQFMSTLYSFDEQSLERQFPSFFSENRDLLEESRGYGYWIWKPFLIFEHLKILPENSVLMYLDCGVSLINDPSPLANLLIERDQLFFNMPQHKNSTWTKRDTFIALGADTPVFWSEPQVKAQWHLWRVCERSLERAQEWYTACRQKHLIDDSPSVEKNIEGFVEHRHDQSILSILVKKWGCEIFRDPTQEGAQFIEHFPNSLYGVIGMALGIR